MSDKYASLSPYVYCADNPVKLVDPNGESIDPDSQESWYNCKQQVLTTLFDRLFSIDGNSSYNRKSVISLSKTLIMMDVMEKDKDWVFSLNEIPGTTGITELQKDPKLNNALFIQISYTGIANLIHEITHGGQFLRGEIGFDMLEKGSYVDIYDELEAYTAQYYYDASSLPLNKYTVLTLPWLLDIMDKEGEYPYRKIGQISYDGNATYQDMMRAYPHNKSSYKYFKGMLKNIPGGLFLNN
jgi:hypothetical protein